ncbi:MAG: 16S rRNA (uracil(1498)-N(3))-methyltransferase [Clostridia bacterium]|nr:16S rRNA (uracil(1498)-N(3))-methyltransferase [Clostridia bacterium]
MRRFWANEQGIRDGLATLSAEDAAHALRVLRMGPGDACELLHEGCRYAAEIASAEGGRVTLRVLSVLPTTEARLRLTLFQGLPKGDKMEWIVQKATELGAAEVVPVQMSRSVVKLSPQDGRKKQERWQKIAREASKQSGRCSEMRVAPPCTWTEALGRISGFACALVPWEEDRSRSIRQLWQADPEMREAAVLIGPEGGISAEEISALKAVGAVPVSLGPRILRTETAGLATLSAMLCLWGDMEPPEDRA